jgi:4-aminobutyrate aminotransferase/(S)-3-amino-2-methylpropionate transaminase
VDADGGVLVDADGNSFVDFASGIAVTSVGASNEKVVEAVREAVGHFTHTNFTTLAVRVLHGRRREARRDHPG